MANEEQVERLKQGVAAWNQWLEDHPDELIELSGSDLTEANLTGIDLSGAVLRGADLNGARLPNAKLSEADLNGANLIRADLRGAHLSGADLSGADLSRANRVTVAGIGTVCASLCRVFVARRG